MGNKTTKRATSASTSKATAATSGKRSRRASAAGVVNAPAPETGAAGGKPKKPFVL